MTIWKVLGIDPTLEERAIKRAYASKLKVTRPDDDPTAFQLLNDAFNHALAQARHQAVAAPVFAADAAQEEIVAAPRMVQPVRAPAGPSAAEQARTLWAGFIGTSTVQPRLHLNKLSDGDSLLNMEVREQFELCAARYCASEACSDDLREAVVKHYQWETDHTLIARELPQETRQMLTYLRAEQSYAFFLQHQSSDPAVKALLAERPGVAWLQTCDSSFMRKMRDLVQTIQQHHPEMLLLKLDQERFAKWEERVARKRYFVQTFIYSFIAGMVLWLLEMFVLARVSDKWIDTAFIAAMVVAYGGFGWYAFKTPAARVQHLLFDVRYRPRWQFGWLLPFVGMSTLLFLPDPAPFTRYVVMGALLTCALAASFAASAVMNGATFFIAIVVGIAVGNVLSDKALAFDPPTCMLAAYCIVLMLVRGGKDLLLLLDVKPGTILRLRMSWIAGVAALVGAAHLPLVLAMPASFAAVCWLWLCAGILLACPSFNLIYGIIGTVAVQLLVFQSLPMPSLLTVQPLTQLFAGMIFVLIFMSVNMIRARRNQHPFT